MVPRVALHSVFLLREAANFNKMLTDMLIQLTFVSI